MIQPSNIALVNFMLVGKPLVVESMTSFQTTGSILLKYSLYRMSFIAVAIGVQRVEAILHAGEKRLHEVRILLDRVAPRDHDCDHLRLRAGDFAGAAGEPHIGRAERDRLLDDARGADDGIIAALVDARDQRHGVRDIGHADVVLRVEAVSS